MTHAARLRELLQESQEMDRKLARLIGEHIDSELTALADLRQAIEQSE